MGMNHFVLGSWNRWMFHFHFFCVQGKNDAKRFSEPFDMNVASFIFRFENKFDR